MVQGLNSQYVCYQINKHFNSQGYYPVSSVVKFSDSVEAGQVVTALYQNWTGWDILRHGQWNKKLLLPYIKKKKGFSSKYSEDYSNQQPKCGDHKDEDISPTLNNVNKDFFLS